MNWCKRSSQSSLNHFTELLQAKTEQFGKNVGWMEA
jgi:hypothetical protein